VQACAEKAPAAMQVLNSEEMRAIVGGPEIQNGGSSPTVVVSTPGNNG